MKLHGTRALAIALLTSCSWAWAAAPASALSFLDVATEGTVGDPGGANQAMIVIDWDSGVSASHAWLFRWDGSARFADAYDAILAAEAGAFSWSQAAFVQFVHFSDGDGDDHLTGAPSWLSFWSSSDGESWSITNLGVYDEPLVDGGWAGANANLPSGTWPGSAPAVPVPEPGSGLLVALGLGGLTARARCRRPACRQPASRRASSEP